MTTLNPFNAASPLRSQRVQGSLIVLIALAGKVFGLPYLDEAALTQYAYLIGTLLVGVGAIRAKNSARPF
ncbi:MAG TPA: hypothetical protein VM285_06975 [Polyangia bacterium]|nr:hypothetical protein [Polyangia bacterium]